MRVSVVGVSGSGKSTFGRALAERAGVPFIELDSIRHQAGWTELPDDEFRERVAEATAAEAWVVDGNYEEVRPIIVARATDVVWIDPRKSVVMAQVIGRSIHRAVTRRELWNGNREDWRAWASPEHPIRWAWATYDRKQVSYPERFASEAYAHVRVHRLRGRRQVARGLERLAGPFPGAPQFPGPGPGA
ncbi:MAG: AAA family ATPase [Acidimicrobiales bacterium]